MSHVRVFLGSIAVLALAGAANAALIFDTTVGAGGSGTAGLLFTTNNPNASIGDAFIVDHTVSGGGIARRINFGFVVPANADVPNADALVTFYNMHDGAAAGTDLALDNVLGTLRINVGAFAPNVNARGFVTGMVDLLAPIDLSGGERGISIRFVAAGTNDIFTGATITPGFSTGAVGVGTAAETFFYLDGFGTNALDGNYVGAERVGFGGANENNNKLWLQIDNIPSPGAASLLIAFGVLSLRRRR